MGVAIDSYLPTVERARAAGITAAVKLPIIPVTTDLLTSDPTSVERLAVVIVDAKVQRRDVNHVAKQISLAAADRLPNNPPPPPEPGTRARMTFLIERHDQESDCAMCEHRRGESPCSVCGQRGRIAVKRGDKTEMVRCNGCDGKGWTVCSVCDGVGNAVWARLGEVTDELHTLRYAYVPSMLVALDLAVGELFETLATELPEALRFDPTPRRQESAYRGATKQTVMEFHGHGFGDALPRATSALAGLKAGGEVVHEDIKAYAWPLLWLSYRSLGRVADVALLIAPGSHALSAVVVEPD